MTDLEHSYSQAGILLLHIARSIGFSDVSMASSERSVVLWWQCKINGRPYAASHDVRLDYLHLTEIPCEVIARQIVADWKRAASKEQAKKGGDNAP